MGFEYINPHADIPLFKAAAATLKELGSRAMSVAGAVAEGVAAGVNSTIDGFASVSSTAMGAFHSSSPSQETSVAKVREQEIQVAAAKTTVHDVPMHDIGSFSAPSFGSGMGGMGGHGR